MEKTTYATALDTAISILSENAAYEDVCAKLASLKLQLAKRASKPHGNQEANIKLAEAIVKEMLPNEEYTVSQLIRHCPSLHDLSTQRVTPILYNLVDAGKIQQKTFNNGKRKMYVKMEEA